MKKYLIRKSSLTNNLIFNIKCRNEGLIPRSSRVKDLIRSTSGIKIAERASHSNKNVLPFLDVLVVHDEQSSEH